MKYNPDKDKYEDAKVKKTGSVETRPDPGYFNYKNMMDQFFSWQPDKDDDEGRAYKYSMMGDWMTDGFKTQLAMGMGHFQAGISKDMMRYASQVGQQEQVNMRNHEFALGMKSMDKQYELQNQFANQQFNRDVGMLDATGTQARLNMDAQGIQDRLNKITDAEQVRETMTHEDNIAAGKERRQRGAARNLARSF